MKGLVLLGLFKFRRTELDGLTDGIIYASMVGLGFAMSENVSYYLAALNSRRAGSAWRSPWCCAASCRRSPIRCSPR